MNRNWKLLLIVAASLVVTSPPIHAQGLLDKAKNVAKKTSVGKSLTKLGTEAQMLDAPSFDLEPRNIPTVAVGSLQLGISGVDIKNNEAVRLKLYLFNPAKDNTAVPLPPPDMFVLVDEKGRRLTLVGELSVKDLPAGAAEITVPGMERVEMSILFASMAADAKLATLKIGSTGTIAGIPVNTAVAGTPAASTSAADAKSASASPWKR
jgi:hypothetical protein